MKKNLSIAAVALMALLTVSCGDRVKTQEVSIEEAESLYVRKPAMHLEGSDTSEVLAQVNTFLECLKTNQTSEAVSMLYQLKREVVAEKKDAKADQSKTGRPTHNAEVKYSVVPLPADLAKTQREVFERFHGATYELDSYEFFKETDCQVKYTVTFPAEGGNTPRMTFVMKPVRFDGKWYLTMADTEHGEAGKSEIKN